MLPRSIDSLSELLTATRFLWTPTDAGANAEAEVAKATRERVETFIVVVFLFGFKSVKLVL
jgi:hypothetical protein